MAGCLRRLLHLAAIRFITTASDVGWFGQRCHHAATGTFLTSGAVGIALTGTTGRTARSGSRANGRLD
jgi:hypothetical protein